MTIGLKTPQKLVKYSPYTSGANVTIKGPASSYAKLLWRYVAAKKRATF